MRKFQVILLIILSTHIFGQGATKPVTKLETNLKRENSIYQLYPTKNFYTFLKLDTRNGKIWQVHFTVANEGFRGELILNSSPLVSKELETIGRFTLYPTENTYNYLLLDQIDGLVYQAQWSNEAENRAIMSISKVD